MISINCQWCDKLAFLFMGGFARRLQNVPSIMFWGIVIWISWIMLFGFLVVSYIVNSNRSEANAQQFKEIVANQQELMKKIDELVSLRKQHIDWAE